MVICKYFLRGLCNFGQNCRNEHTYNETSTSIMKKPDVIDMNALTRSLSTDMLKAEKGNQWPISCYGPFPERPCYPGLEDKSMEEERCEFYNARQNTTLEEYKNQFAQRLENSKSKMRSFQSPSSDITNTLQKLCYSNTPAQNSGYNVSSNVFNISQASATSLSNFANTCQSENKDVHGNNKKSSVLHSNSIFDTNANQTSFLRSNVFGGSTSVEHANMQSFNNSVFNPSRSNQVTSNDDYTGTLFVNSKGLLPTPPEYSLNMQNNPVYESSHQNTSIFPRNNQNQRNTNIFCNTSTSQNVQTSFPYQLVQPFANSDSGNNFYGDKMKTKYDEMPYSEINDVSAPDIKEFESKMFTFGKIPLIPPPPQLC